MFGFVGLGGLVGWLSGWVCVCGFWVGGFVGLGVWVFRWVGWMGGWI